MEKHWKWTHFGELTDRKNSEKLGRETGSLLFSDIRDESELSPGQPAHGNLTDTPFSDHLVDYVAMDSSG